MSALEPRDGFNWSRVIWSRPDASPSVLCSYCSAVLPEHAVPLILFKAAGDTAQFCRDCQVRWWGFQLDDDDEQES